MVLIAAAVLVAGGFLNFAQRSRHETPPWDGVTWVDARQGIQAETVEPGSSGARAWILPGDRLIAVSLDGVRRAEIGHAKDVQSVGSSHVGDTFTLSSGPLSRRESAVFRRPRHLDAPQVDTSRSLHQPDWLVYLLSVSLCFRKVAGRRCYSLLRLPGGFCFHLTPVGSYRD